MGEALETLWLRLPVAAQDLAALAALLAPGLALGLALWTGFRPWPLIAALLRRHLVANLVFVALIAASVGVGTGLIAQERGLLRGAARAAAPFDLIVAAPGSEVTMLLATVFLQPTNAPLLDGDAYAAIAADPRVAFAAPVAFGDSVDGAPVVGVTAALAEHVGGPLAEGRMFRDRFEAIAGAAAALPVGARFSPSHGRGFVEGDAHDVEIAVVGRMRPTGSPWDRAILTPIEGVWSIHGLADGHGPDRPDAIGPPFDPAYFPGAPAVVVRATGVAAAYGLRGVFSRPDMMAFFPGGVLAELQGLVGDVRAAMSALALTTQGLVAAATLAGLALITRLFAPRLALLRALGAPGRFVLAVVWGYAATLILSGVVLGLGVGFALSAALSAAVSARTDVAVATTLGWPELHLAAGFASAAMTLALSPALLALRRPPAADLQS